MMTRNILLLTCTVLMVAAPLFAQPVTVTALASPARVLRGLPVGLIVTIANGSAASQTIMDGVQFRVTAGGESFAARFGDNEIFSFPKTAGCASGADCFTLPAGASRTVYFDFTSTLDGNPLFLDSRLSKAGTFNVQVEVRVDHQSTGIESVLSSPAVFTVDEPSGVDAELWQRMTGPTQRGWSAADWTNVGKRLASGAYASPSDSSYAPWLAGLVQGTTTQQIAAYDLALSRNIPPALRDALLYGKAVALNGASANSAWADFDADLAVTYADGARAALDQLIKVTAIDVVRQQATDLRGQLLTQAGANELVRSHLAAEPPAPLAVMPRVECVSPGTGKTFTAVFGYTNPNRSGKVLLISDANQMTPAPRDQGQPRLFRPGSHSAALTASSPGGELIWHLDGSLAKATADFAVRCASP